MSAGLKRLWTYCYDCSEIAFSLGQGRSAFLHRPVEILEMLEQLLQRKTESKNAFYLIDRQAARQSLAAKHGDFCGVAGERQLDSIERRRMAPPQQCRAARLQIVTGDLAYARQRWSEPRPKCLRKQRIRRPSDHDEVVAQPLERA